MLIYLGKFIAAINGNSRAGAMAAGIGCGVLLGLMPAANLLWIVLFLLMFITKIHLPSFGLALAVVKLLHSVLDGIVDNAGFFVLGLDFLRNFFTTLYNASIVPFTMFNSTLVMGGLVIGIIAFVPLWFLFFYLIKLYRNKVHPKIAQSKIVKLLKKSPFFTKLGKAIGSSAGAFGSWR